jgi:hypothetical protein
MKNWRTVLKSLYNTPTLVTLLCCAAVGLCLAVSASQVAKEHQQVALRIYRANDTIFCTPGVPEPRTAQPAAIGRSGDQNETTNMPYRVMLVKVTLLLPGNQRSDGEELRWISPTGLCGWDGSRGVWCQDPAGLLVTDQLGRMMLTTPGGAVLTGADLARALGLEPCE